MKIHLSLTVASSIFAIKQKYLNFNNLDIIQITVINSFAERFHRVKNSCYVIGVTDTRTEPLLITESSTAPTLKHASIMINHQILIRQHKLQK